MEYKMNKKTGTKKTFWAIAFFYFLIAFEFLYMATPFALYFYGTYKPGLSFISEIPALSWLASFFLPHVVLETKSTIINSHNMVGAVITIIGLVLFCIGAFQVYYSKLFKKGAVIGGLYKIIRHPQYTSFATCGFGLLILWPRYLVLIMFITLLFGYYFLAKIEEHECINKFGKSYKEYMNRTNMFIPVKFNALENLFYNLSAKFGKGTLYVTTYILLLITSLGVAKILQTYSINNLFKLEKNNIIFVSITEIEENNILFIDDIISKDSLVANKISSTIINSNWLINYIVPQEVFISEIPMTFVNNNKYAARNHFMNNSTNKTDKYKVIITKAIGEKVSDYRSLFRQPTILIPVVEVWIDLTKKSITKIYDSVSNSRYENIPVPIF
jgi:protein-S-isoprenylcysteine O-methyltransferase Ste14